MADYPARQVSDEQLAELQKLSEQYQPETHGPLVGQRQPSTALTTEYALADATYKTKTAALPQKYSHYRTVRGDGNCGWRAVAFGYFEALVHYGDVMKFSLEEARLRSLNNVIASAGFDPMLFEDFADETFTLLRKAQDALSLGNAEDVLLETFNDDMIQNYIITHLRTLTAAWMKGHDENFAPWLPNQTVDQYCEQSVLPVAAEIDHIGLVALKDALLSPASLSLEVIYLDRSEGSEVNMHRFDPITGGPHSGFVRLLYRPGHYDILYKREDLSVSNHAVHATAPAVMPTYLQYATHSNESVYELGMPDSMTSIPGISFVNRPPNGWMSSTYNADEGFFNHPVPMQSCTPTIQSMPMSVPPPVYVMATMSPQVAPPPAEPLHELPIRNSVPQTTVTHTDFQLNLNESPFRPSAWQLEPDFVEATSQIPFQTSIFRNSHFNTAHFLNPAFQPEQWDPSDEYAIAGSSSHKSSRHRSIE